MFKKFRNALTEVTEEVKSSPRFQNLNQLAAQTYSSMNSDPLASSSDPSQGLSSSVFLREDANSEFFTLGEGHSDSGALGFPDGEDAALFPSYESPLSPPPTLELESATEAESSIASEASVISKEQLLSMLSRSRSRVHKYKSRYALLQKAYQDVSAENQKIATVMQQTQDKALRRISELREQCQLSQKAKQHLEEELRGDMEEKEHIIKTLETKVALLKSGGEVLNKNGDDASENHGPLVVVDMDEKPSPAAQEKMIHLEEKVKRLENLLTKCKESITANKQKIAALIEVKENLSKQLSEKSVEVSTLTSKYDQEVFQLKGERDEALQTCEGLRTKDQNEELQIAESKLMVHQEMITKDEEISKLRHNLQMMTNDRDSQTQTIVELNNEISQLTAAQKTLERSLEEERSSTLQELSRGQTEALETLKSQLEEERDRLSSEFAQERSNLKKSHEEEQQKAVNKVHLEKKRELRILEDEMKAKLVEKDNENRLAIEEAELRIKSLVAADEKKSELLRDLEMNLKLLSKDKASKEREIEGILKEVSALKTNKEKADKLFADQEEALKLELDHLKSQAESDGAKVEELNNVKLDLLSQIESKDSLIRSLEESRTSQDSLECRYYNESLPDIIQSKEDEINKIKEESKLERSVLNEELAQLKSENMDLRNKSLQENPSELEEKKQEIIKLEGELGSLLAAKQDLEATFNAYKDEQEVEKEAIKKQLKLESIDALSKKDELIKTISLESSNEMEKLKKELHELRKDSDTNLENLKSVNESKITKLEAKHSANLSEIEEKHLKEIEEMNLKISELRQGKNVEFLEENSKLQKSLSSLEEKFKGLSEELSETIRQKTQVQKNLEEKLVEIDRMKESHKNMKDLENSFNDHEKEIASLRERERSQKDFEAQMIRYQKELQNQIKGLEDRDEEKNNIIHDLRLESDNKSLEIKKNAEKFHRQVSDLKQDLEMKIRVERDRENAHSELKRQSIEYQKKLQEQLQEKESFLTAAKDEISCFEGKIANLNGLHSREIERLSNRISELTQTVKELEERRDCDIDLNEKTLKECDNLREDISALTEDLEKKDNEISHLKESEISLNAQLQENQSKECVHCPSLQTDIKSLNDELSSRKEIEKSLRQEVADKNSSYHDLEKEISDKNAEVEQLAEKERELQESLTSQTILLSKKETSYLGMMDQIKNLKELLESIQEEKEDLAADFADLESKLKEDTSKSNKDMKLQSEELEAKLREIQEENKDLVVELKTEHEQELASVLRRQEERVSEMEELFESQKKNYENSIEELSGKVLKLQEENASHSWGGWDHEPIDLQNHIQSFNQNEDSIQEHSIATLKISNNNRTNSTFGCSLEEAAEFEYLKNILYQYMLGKESLTLAKVLATVVKFNQEQINKIMQHEEQKKSLLSAFGLHNST